jgi:2-keto-4-pentenoate hydratase/2-oxohepta-3-ene-1,7-dioic acid hydratase in catechol pathway
MRWSSYVSPTDQLPHIALVVDGKLHGLREQTQLIELLDDDEVMALSAERALADPIDVLDLDTAEVLAPIPVPPSVRDFYAFESHVLACAKALEQPINPDWYELPVFYFQNPQATRGHRADVDLAPGSVRFDFELEVAAVVGKPGRDLHPEEAEQHIAGYMLMSDWSARDLQAREMKQTMGPVKGKDTATSYGPWLVTPDELVGLRGGNAYNLEMTASVNGRSFSRGNLGELYWSFGQMMAYASRGTQLVTGDIIGSGTVGTGCILELSLVHGVDQYPFLKAGDDVRLDVEELGHISARLVEGSDVIPLR